MPVAEPQSPPSLPVDSILEAVREALATHAACVLQASPGAGKTTRVPLALLDVPWLTGKKILMLEPRRLAASNAARYMARQLGEEVGATVGYAIRFERCVSAATRIEVVTEGILTRRLQSDPELSDVGLVIFDEFHERNLNSDLALALCRDAQLGLRDDLRLLVMSATLDAEPVARLLGDCPLLTSTGRAWPVTVRWLADAGPGRLVDGMVTAIRQALHESDGDVLAFFPGVGEIRRCVEQLADLRNEVLLAPLYAELPFKEQEKAILPQSRRKIVLATNIAETSLTIDGVRVVVDSGYERRPHFDAGRGMSSLELVRISRASADQRAGRAGRLGPGHCYRLWSEGSHGSLLPYAPPEIRTADLTGLALELARWGVKEASQLSWLDPPPAGHLIAARQLLQQLDALDGELHLTSHGAAMTRWPLHPRLASLLLAAQATDRPEIGCRLAALLSERDILVKGAHAVNAAGDLCERLALLARWQQHGEALPGVDGLACAAVLRTERFLTQLLKRPAIASTGTATAQELAPLLMAAWPERIGREREPGSGRYLLANGLGACFGAHRDGRSPAWLVAIELASGRGADGEIRLASPLSPAQVEAWSAAIPWQREVHWDERQERVLSREVRRIGALPVAERPVVATESELVAALANALRRLGLAVLGWSPASTQLLARVRFVTRVVAAGEWPVCDDAALLATLEEWLGPYLGSCRSRGDLARLDPGEGLRQLLGGQRLQQLAQWAPERLAVPSGSNLLLDYVAGDVPVLEVKLQELFGLAETPRIAGGRVAVLLHLLSPARRPIAVTSDLRSFWNTVYPEVKRELKGRYPRHPWPDDPWSAVPTRQVKRRA